MPNTEPTRFDELSATIASDGHPPDPRRPQHGSQILHRGCVRPARRRRPKTGVRFLDTAPRTRDATSILVVKSLMTSFAARGTAPPIRPVRGGLTFRIGGLHSPPPFSMV